MSKKRKPIRRLKENSSAKNAEYGGVERRSSGFVVAGGSGRGASVKNWKAALQLLLTGDGMVLCCAVMGS